MTPEQREELKAAAMKLNESGWTASEQTVCGDDGDGVCACYHNIGHMPLAIDASHRADFIAAANPAAILSLIAQVEALTVPQVSANVSAMSMQPLCDRVLDALTEARSMAMRNAAEARIPECGNFAAIAQNLDWAITNMQPSGNTGELAKRTFSEWFDAEYPRNGDRRPKYQQSSVMTLMQAAWAAARSNSPEIEGITAQGEDARSADVLKALMDAPRAIAQRADTVPKGNMAQAYTCNGKGGDYEFIGTAHGAGTSREKGCVLVYMDVADGALYFRTPTDFADRMTAIPAIPGTKEAPCQK